MAPRAPAGALAQKERVIRVADEDAASGLLRLRMALQAKVGVALNKQLPVNGSVRIVADGAAFSESFVLEDKWTGLLAMALSARFIQPPHGESPDPLENVRSVRIVTVNAIHALLEDGVMLRQLEFRVSLEMALKASRGIFSGVDYEFADPPSRLDVFASRSVARLTTCQARHFRALDMNACMRTGGEASRDVRMTVETGFVADVTGAGDFRRRHHRSLDTGARTGDQSQHDCRAR